MPLRAVAFACVLASWVLMPSTCAHARDVTGWVERVQLGLNAQVVRAKVDTGADYSSLHAQNIRLFTRDGQDWVAFDLISAHGANTTHELPVARMARIKRHTTTSQERAVVAIGICLGTRYKVTEVNLTDRSRFDYPMLIGRSFLGNDFLVDPAGVFLLEPQCKELE